MLNKIIDLSLRNRLAVVVIAGMLLVWGCFVILRTEVDIFPDLNAPTIAVMTEAPGMAPEEVESIVTFPIESALNGATSIRRVRSSSTAGFSVVWAEFDWDTDVYNARQIVAERISSVKDALPPGVGTPTMGPQSSILGEVMIIGLTSDSIPMMQLRSIADREIAPRLLSIRGVSQVSVIGGDVAEYQILLNPDKMRHFSVTLDEVRGAVEGMNSNVSGGVLYDYGNEYLIRGAMHTMKADEIAKAVVKTQGGMPVTLGDVAEVKLGPKSPRLGAASKEGRQAVLMTVTKQPGVGTIQLTENIEEQLDDLRHTLPKSLTVSTDIFSQSEFIENSISNLQTSLFEGALFVAIVLFFFLMNLRTTLISLIALPLSIVVTLIIINLLGFTINTMSLGGIAIAIGSLVDDAIVDVENVHKRLLENRRKEPSERKNALKVIFEASAEVRLPILNSSLIIIASFLPMFFLTGIEGKMMVPLGISFIIALVASTLVALTLTPVMCYFLLGRGKGEKALDKEPRFVSRLRRGYSSSLAKSLKRGKLVVGVTGGLFAVAVALLFTLGRSFLPSFNEGSLTINVSSLPGISLERSDSLGRMAERIILQTPEIETVARKTGRAELDEHALGTNVSEIEAPYKLKGRSREAMVKEIRENLAQLPGVSIEIGQPISHRIDAMLSGTEAQIAIKVFGNDLETLHKTATRIQGAVSEVPGIVDVNVEQLLGSPRIDIRPRREMMAAYGVTNAAFIQSVNTLLGGEEVSLVYDNTLPYDVTLKLADESRNSVASVGDLLIDTPTGAVPLSYLADVVSTTGPNAVHRENVSRRIVVSANVEGRDLRSSVNDIRKKVETEVKLPEGYHVSYGGQFESEESATRTLLWASLGALLLIFILLYAEYHSVSESLLIMVNMPLALIGGVFILFLMRSELNIPAIIGFISLMGIATRNGMLLISRYNALLAGGMELHEAVKLGSADRLRPIIMTALTSFLALVPLALRGGEAGNEIQSPMAIVLIGGLFSATLLNIYVVPIIFEWLKLRKGRKDA